MCLINLVGVVQALKGRVVLPTMMFGEKKYKLMEKLYNTILLCLDNEVLHKVVEEDTTVKLLLKLKSLYMMKSLTNHLHLKKRLFTL